MNTQKTEIKCNETTAGNRVAWNHGFSDRKDNVTASRYDNFTQPELYRAWLCWNFSIIFLSYYFFNTTFIII